MASFTKYSGNEKKALLHSTLIFALILILLFFWKITYKNSGNEGGGGIEIDFGNAEYGLGDDNTSMGAPATDNNVNETYTAASTTPINTRPVVTNPTSPVTPAPPTDNNEILSSTNEDAIAIKKKKQEEAIAAERARVEEAKRREQERIRREQEEFAKKMQGGISSIKNGGGTGGTGTGSGQGDTKAGGNQGDLSGIDGGTGTGGSGGGTGGGHGTGTGAGIGSGQGGISHTLANRNIISKPQLTNRQSALGKVVIRVKVDRNGQVLDATYVSQGSTTNDGYLINLSKDAAMKVKFSPSATSTEEQFGTITFNYTQ